MNSIIKKPWGNYKVLNRSKNHLIKKIFVKSGGKLSLQSHKHRSEYWIVLEGAAKVTLNDSVKSLKISESIYIPRLAKHRLENIRDKKLLIMEVQFGDILSEKDIVRYDDIYNRKTLNDN